MSEPMEVWHHPIHSDLDYIPCMEVTTELEITTNPLSNSPFKQGIHNTRESTASFDRLISTFVRLGEIMNKEESYSNGIAKIIYNDKTYNMRNKEDAKELRRVAIHYVGLPDL
ncbi:MAG: hypothetical protein IJS58_05930 [Bacilli bacterium]|nr:hypothetical protein [Bacilli bacterium]